MNGGITWYVVSRLVTQNNQQALAVNVVNYQRFVNAANCLERSASGKCMVLNRDPDTFRLLLGLLVQSQQTDRQVGDRLLVLDNSAPPAVVYDSMGGSGTQLDISLDNLAKGQKVTQGTTLIYGRPYLYAAVTVSGPFAHWVVLARPEEAVTAQTNRQLFPGLLGASGAALLLAVLISMFLARALTRPLRELRGAAEDIAAGNYARRVVEAGPGEVGVVAKAFNRMAEAVERARKQQREFLADVSHELKTPLTSLIGFSEAMVDGSLRTDQEHERAAKIVNEEAHRVLRMAQELLDLARVEAGHVTYNPEPVDLVDQLGQETNVVRPRADRRGLRLQLDAAGDVPAVRADPERLHQILGNLLDNAVKYAPEGSEVKIVAESHPHWVVTEVRNLVGAHPPDPERMFDRFYRADPARSSGVSGVGLGLAIASELTTAQGGSLMAYTRGDWLHVRLAMPVDGDGRTNEPPAQRRQVSGQRSPRRLPTGSST
jgi:signal transduction histidine kinase